MANLSNVRLVSSCLAATVCLRFHEVLADRQTKNDAEQITEHDNDALLRTQHDADPNNSPYRIGSLSDSPEAPSPLRTRNGKMKTLSNHSQSTQKHKHREKSKKHKRRRLYLIADLSNIGCSVSIIECLSRKRSEMVRVHYLNGDVQHGLWRMITAFALYVVRCFVDGYRNSYAHSLEHRVRPPPIPLEYSNDTPIYTELQRIEEIEAAEVDEFADESGEALKCRFRALMLCDAIIAQLHDQYRNEEVQIHYERFYRSFSLQLILTSHRLREIALAPFLFRMTSVLDKILQHFEADIRPNIEIEKESESELECVLIGDGGQIPSVVALFAEYLDVLHSAHVSDGISGVARGCAIACAAEHGFDLAAAPLCLDVLSHSLRIQRDGTESEKEAENELVIAAQTPIPCKKTLTRSVFVSSVCLSVFEGESVHNKLCRRVGVFEVCGVPKRSKRTKLVVAVHVDRNGIMRLSAEDVTSKPPLQLRVVKIA